jgi:hypothetical protein
MNQEPHFPVYRYYQDQPVPDLRRIPRERWFEVLAPLEPEARHVAANTAPGSAFEIWALLGKLELHDGQRNERLRRAERPRSLEAPTWRPGPKRGRQVNIRLYGRDHAALVQALRWSALGPRSWRRTFVVRGARRVLYEQRRMDAEGLVEP